MIVCSVVCSGFVVLGILATRNDNNDDGGAVAGACCCCCLLSVCILSTGIAWGVVMHDTWYPSCSTVACNPGTHVAKADKDNLTCSGTVDPLSGTRVCEEN